MKRGCASFNLSCLSSPPVLCEMRLQVLWGNWLHNQTFPNFEHFEARSSTAMGGGSSSKRVQRYFFILIVKTTAILYSFSVLIMSLRKRHSTAALKINIAHYNSRCLLTDLHDPCTHAHPHMKSKYSPTIKPHRHAYTIMSLSGVIHVM